MRKPYLVVFALVAGLSGLAGCGGGGGADPAAPRVASVSRAAVAESSTAPAAHGPQARLDTTDAEKDAWARAYSQCLVDQGWVLTDRQKETLRIKGVLEWSKAPAAAQTACVSKKPTFVPPEMDPAKNPNYRQQWHEDVECLKRKGMPIRETEDGWTYTSSDAVIPANSEQLQRDCDLEAFGGK